MKIKIDSRIQTLLENGRMTNTRSIFLIVGDRGRDRVVDIHMLISKQRLSRPSVLWCYRDDLGFSSHKKKRMRQIKRAQQRGTYDPELEDPFDVFISSTEIRYCYYKESHKILGTTVGLLILQDFESLTPNLLCRTLETVEGGGSILILLKSMSSLKQLYTLAMDVHQRYRTPSHEQVQPRFNERFLLSLSICSNCLVMDDEFNILRLTDHAVTPVPEELPLVSPQLLELQQSLADTEVVGPLVAIAKTLDQATVILQTVSALRDRGQAVTGVTAGRGRGKSAALGLGASSAIAFGYSSIVVTAPAPENLTAFFDFFIRGLKALGLKEHSDFEVTRGAKDLKKCVLKIEVNRTHRQTVQYVTVNTTNLHTDLLVIDEAAAIPLPFVRQMLGPYPVLISSTVHGYEGTGRALSLKLFSALKNFKHLKMNEPIRYSSNDSVEKWLNDLLCLEATVPYALEEAPPHPSDCSLYLVNRDTLFSYNRASELFLHRLMSLFVSSHYKNSPNDLQMLSDAPSHLLFVLLGPIQAAEGLPDILCALQVSLEGKINEERSRKQLAKGFGGTGDMVPWTVAEYFQEPGFCQLTGARVVRIASHPDLHRSGYGSRALQELSNFLMKRLGEGGMDIEEPLPDEGDDIAPRKLVKPLLQKLSETNAPDVDYMSVAYGLSDNLYGFWEKAGFTCVYLKQKQNEATGEYSAIMLRSLNEENKFEGYFADFSKRFKNLLGFEFGKLPTALALRMIKHKGGKDTDSATLARYLTLYDLKRLEAFTKKTIDYHLILDLLPSLAEIYYSGLIGLELSTLQQKILVGVALQRKPFNLIPQEIDMPFSQTVLLFNKIVKLITMRIKDLFENDIQLPQKRQETS